MDEFEVPDEVWEISTPDPMPATQVQIEDRGIEWVSRPPTAEVLRDPAYPGRQPFVETEFSVPQREFLRRPAQTSGVDLSSIGTVFTQLSSTIGEGFRTYLGVRQLMEERRFARSGMGGLAFQPGGQAINLGGLLGGGAGGLPILPLVIIAGLVAFVALRK